MAVELLLPKILSKVEISRNISLFVPHLISGKTCVEGLHTVLCPVKILSKKWIFLETISLFIRNLFLEKTDVEGLHSCSG